jgi:phage repressor protein C with HTH and peptisase S24 domain
MAIQPAASGGLQAIQAAQTRVQNAATDIAANRAGEPDADNRLANALVDLSQAKVQAEAGAKVIDTENRTIGSLLDVKV